MWIERCEGVFGVSPVAHHFPNFWLKSAVRGTDQTLIRSRKSKSLCGLMPTTNVPVNGLGLKLG
jgi:hypothetical protein